MLLLRFVAAAVAAVVVVCFLFWSVALRSTKFTSGRWQGSLGKEREPCFQWMDGIRNFKTILCQPETVAFTFLSLLLFPYIRHHRVGHIGRGI